MKPILSQVWFHILIAIVILYTFIHGLLIIFSLKKKNKKLKYQLLQLSTNKENVEKENIKNTHTADEVWMKEVEIRFKKHFAEPHFKIEWIAYEMNMSERQLTRRIEKSTGMTPNHYLRETRLQAAKDLLTDRRFKTVKEICFAVGFTDIRYFSKLFIERFGMRPSELLH